MTDSGKTTCGVCSKAASQFCSSCKSVAYCSKECQKRAWKEHKSKCRPFKIHNHPIYGRCLIATRDIKTSEVFLKEAPIVLGPKQFTVPVCLGCHKKVTGQAFCKQCNFPLCAPSCQKSIYHKTECAVLARGTTNITFTDFSSAHPAYECITPLRCFLLKDTDPKKWESMMSLQSHLEELKGTPIYNVNQRNIVEFIRSFLPKKADAADDDKGEALHRICGILQVNAFELLHNGQKIRGLYPNSSMFAHDCTPNAKHAFDATNNIIFRASQTIRKGEPIFATYSHVLWDTHSRRHQLKMFKFFVCNCKRCLDPTELQTNLSTLLCINCGGEIRSSDPNNHEAMWVCYGCDHTILAKQVKWANEELNKELRSYGRCNDPNKIVDFMERYKKTLHPNHRFNVEAKYALIKLYGNVPNFYYKDLSHEQIENKVKWCRELMEVADIVDPCKSLLRGTILFELQASLVAKAKVLLSNDLITQEEAGSYMTEAVGYLQEASEILKHEPNMADGGLDEKLKWLSTELEI